jgi:Fe-S cluster biogenesis protein NfuA
MFALRRVNKKPINSFYRYLSIKTLTTPNENALKFQTDVKLLTDNKSYQINLTNQHQSPLASKIFEYSNDVESILIGSDFITVNKNEFAHWNQVKPLVESILENHINKKEAIVNESSSTEIDQQFAGKQQTEEEIEIAEEIEELIETKIRPAIQEDGGDIVFLRFEEGKVYVQLQGACTSCSLSDDTLKSGIHSMLSHYIEGIDEVVNLAELEFSKFEEKMKLQRESRA